MSLTDLLNEAGSWTKKTAGAVGNKVANAAKKTGRGAARLGKSTVNKAGRAARATGGLIGAIGEFRIVQQRRYQVRDHKDYKIGDPVPWYGENEGGIKESLGTVGHIYNESSNVRNGIKASAAYIGLGLGGNLVSLITGEPSVNTIMDMSAGPVAYLILAQDEGDKRGMAKTLGMYALAATVGWDVATDFVGDTGYLSVAAQAVKDVFTHVTYLSPGGAGALIGLAARPVKEVSRGISESKERKALPGRR
jgi:hypothetical protein